MRLRWAGLPLVGFGVQAIVGFTSTPPALLAMAMGLIALFLALFLWLNRTRAGLLIACVGLVANTVVIAANGGMPVSQPAMASIGSTAIAVNDARHTYADDATRLGFLGDVIPLGNKVLSPGDILLAAGLTLFLISLVRDVLRASGQERM